MTTRFLPLMLLALLTAACEIGGRPLMRSSTKAGRGSDPTTEVGNNVLIST